MAERRLGFPEPAMSRDPPFAVRRRLPVVGRRGMVCAAHPLVASAGIAALAKGGNAVDAAVAAGLAAAVVMPEMCGLGGDLFAIVHSGKTGEGPVAFLGGGAAPMGASLAMVRAAGEPGRDGSPRMPLRGPLSIGVPGMVDGYGALMKRFGRLGFAAAAERAITLAEEGAPISSLAYLALRVFGDVLDETARAIYLPGGAAPRPGSLAPQMDLAATLRTLAREGPRAFYEGDVAARIAAGLQAAGGAMDEGDLARHRTVVEAPIATTYRGFTVHQTGLPSQGMILLEALNIVEAGDLAALDGAAAVHLMAEALKCAFADRIAGAGDPRFVDDPTPLLISKSWAKGRLAAIDPDRAAEAETPELVAGDTTYICAADGDGMMVSLIQSVSSAFGSGIVAGDTGVLLNNRAGRGFSLEDGSPNLYAPGKRTVSTLNCYLVTDEAGAPVIAAGTPGGDGQPQWNLQVLHGMIDRGLDAQLATEQPRWSLWPGTDPHNRPNPFHIFAEDRMGAELLAALEAKGHVFQSRGDWGAEGAAQVIARDPATGALVGGSDPRVEGMAIGL